MTTPNYFHGQRWISNTESELGLGIVEDNRGRLVTLTFPAAGEKRTYAIDNAPLSRVQYQVGEKVGDIDGQEMTITERHEHNGCFIYIGIDNENNTLTLPELELDSFVQFSKPQDRLFAGQIDKNSSFQLRVETLSHMHRHQQSTAYGLLGARVQLLPHQLFIASQVSQRHNPRVLLADEVGLGKTIEAGLIIHQQLISGVASRVLIVVPDSLLHQWLVEMLRRFNLHFTILDEERCLALEESEEGNPFESSQLILCSLSFLTDSQTRQKQANVSHWDLLIVDEAHHLLWTEQESSHSYLCIEALAARISGLLLLTATPEQLGVDSHFARLRLLDPDRYHDLQKFREEEQGYQHVSELVRKLQSEDVADQLKDSPEFLQQLQQYLGEKSLEELHHMLADGDIELAIDKAIHTLLDHHGTGRVLFRNTREAVAGFPERKLHSWPLTAPDAYLNQLASASLDDLLHPENLLGDSWTTLDPRVNWITDWLKTNRDEKVLIICSSATTAQSLEDYLRLRQGMRSSVFHEGLSLIARDRAAAYFSEMEEGAQILVCSEIGSEGRNFQFAQHLVLFDLPLNPDLLEQRIGRLDRIGQKHTVQIHVPHYFQSPQQVLLRWYHEGINAIERVCPAGQALFNQQHDDLFDCLTRHYNDDILETLISSTRTLAESTLNDLQQGRDLLLEMNSCQPIKAEGVVQTVANATYSTELSSYMEHVFDQFGVEQQTHGTHSIILHPGDHMLSHDFPSLPEDGLTATYQRTQALVREDMHFLTWEHPMVSGAMDMIINDDFGNAALCTLSLPGLKPGTLLLEAIFVVYCPAPRSLQLQRYIPQSSVRLVVDINQNNLTDKLTEKILNERVGRVPRTTAQELVRHARKQIDKLIIYAETLAKPHQQHISETALESMMELQQTELQRLISLASVNPNIRVEEIDYQRDSIESLDGHLRSAQLKLDAIRVILAT